jgi:aspartate dehydrogenase
MKVGIIGCGFIGTEISRFIDKDKRFRLVGLNDIEKTNFFSLIKKIRSRPKFMEINELIKKCDVIIEAASRNAAKKQEFGSNWEKIDNDEQRRTHK